MIQLNSVEELIAMKDELANYKYGVSSELTQSYIDFLDLDYTSYRADTTRMNKITEVTTDEEGVEIITEIEVEGPAIITLIDLKDKTEDDLTKEYITYLSNLE